MLSIFSLVMAYLPNTARDNLPLIFSYCKPLDAITAPLPKKPVKVNGSMTVDATKSSAPLRNFPVYWSEKAVLRSSALNKSKPADRNLRLLSRASANQPLRSATFLPGDKSERVAWPKEIWSLFAATRKR